MKCDIEISITSEGDEYDKIEIPACLRESSTDTLSDAVKENGIVDLPDRYANKLKMRKTGENGEITNGHTSIGDDLIARENDLTTALKWIKQEIVSLCIPIVLIFVLIFTFYVHAKCSAYMYM